MLIGAFMWALSYGPPSFGRDCRLGLALRRQESLGFECSHAALPSRGHRLAIDIVPHTSQHILSYLSHTFWLGRSEVEEDLVVPSLSGWIAWLCYFHYSAR